MVCKKRIFQTDELRHAFRRHGPGGAGKNEVPITPSDIARIPEIIGSADDVANAGVTGVGLPGLRFVKREADGTSIIIEEVRIGRRRMAFKTMYRLRQE